MPEQNSLPPGLHVLVLDDDPKLRAFVDTGLRHCGAECTLAAVPAEALDAIRGETGPPPDVILLDIMMPNTSGWEVLEQILAFRTDIPVIFLTAREAVEERVRGLRMGADDYMIKPFAFPELIARISVVVRRRRALSIRIANLELDSIHREGLVDGKRISFTPTEFNLLRELIRAGREPQSRRQLLSSVWRTELDPETNVVEVHVARLRRKLAEVGGPVIHTVKNKGYTFSKEP